MNILGEIAAAGLIVSLTGERLEIANPSHLTDGLRNLLRTNKQEIIKQLFGVQLQQDIRECIEERAAIMEFDGGLSRKDAGLAATTAKRVYCYRTTEKPNSELVVIMPGTELDEAIEKLKYKFEEKLLDVYPSPYCMTYIQASITKN